MKGIHTWIEDAAQLTDAAGRPSICGRSRPGTVEYDHSFVFSFNVYAYSNIFVYSQWPPSLIAETY